MLCLQRAGSTDSFFSWTRYKPGYKNLGYISTSYEAESCQSQEEQVGQAHALLNPGLLHLPPTITAVTKPCITAPLWFSVETPIWLNSRYAAIWIDISRTFLEWLWAPFPMSSCTSRSLGCQNMPQKSQILFNVLISTRIQQRETPTIL